MKISTQTEYYLKKGYSLKEITDIMVNAGFDCIDMSFGVISTDRIMDDKFIDELKELKIYADSKGITFNQAHAIAPTSSGEEKEDALIDKVVIRSIMLSSVLGIKSIVVHPKMHIRYKNNEKTVEELNIEYYKSLIPYCEKYNVRVAIENMWDYDSNRGCMIDCVCSKPTEHIRYIDRLNSKWMVACLDVGHSALTGENPADVIRALGHDRLKALHIHDVDYKNDNHTMPGIEKLNFKEIVDALKEINYDGEFTLEADSFLYKFDSDFCPIASKFMADYSKFITK